MRTLTYAKPEESLGLGTNFSREIYTRFDGEVADAAFWRSVSGAQVSTFLVFVCYLIINGVLVFRLIELRGSVAHHDGKRVKRNMYVVKWIFFNALCSLLTQIANMLVFFKTYRGEDWMACFVLGRFPAVFYGAASLGTYTVLLKRASIAVSEKSGRWFYLLYLMTKLTTFVGLPIFVVLTSLVTHGVVLFDAVCAQEFAPALPWIFMAADTSVSVCFLVLFAVPVLKHIHAITNTIHPETENKKLRQEMDDTRRIVWRNFVFSLVQVLTTFVSMFGSCLVALLSNSADTAYLRYSVYIAYPLDMLVNTVCLLLMTEAWIPKRWVRLRNLIFPHASKSKAITRSYGVRHGAHSGGSLDDDVLSSGSNLKSSTSAVEIVPAS